MNKIGGVYFLQYAVPGTQWKSYADGLFTSRGPLGPFAFAKHAPFSHKPTGFAAGAGHSSTFLDAAGGGLWHIGSATISVRFAFERRLGIYPARLVAGELSVDTYLGDYPQPLPGRVPPQPHAASPSGASPRVPRWMLVTYNKTASASSVRAVRSGAPPAGDLPNQSFTPDRAFDEDIRTWYKGFDIILDLFSRVDPPCTIHPAPCAVLYLVAMRMEC